VYYSSCRKKRNAILQKWRWNKMIAHLLAEIRSRQEKIKDLLARLEANQAKMDVEVKEMSEEIHSIRARMRALRDERTEANFVTCRTEAMVYQEETTVASQEDKEPTSKEMESEGERREVPTEEAAVEFLKKRHRGQRIAAGRRVKPTKLIRGDGESWKKLVAACRKVSCSAAVAWRKRNLFRDIRTQGNCGPRQELGDAGIMVTLRARLARRKRTFARKNQTRNQVGRRASRQPVGLKRWKRPADRSGIKYPGGRWPRDLRRDVKEQLRRRIERTTSEIHRKIIRQEVVKRATEMSTGLLKMRNWALWRGRPPPKQLKREPYA
jgi:hypothetical protein